MADKKSINRADAVELVDMALGDLKKVATQLGIENATTSAGPLPGCLLTVVRVSSECRPAVWGLPGMSGVCRAWACVFSAGPIKTKRLGRLGGCLGRAGLAYLAA